MRLFLLTESPLKMMNNTFYIISKALFFLRIFKLCLAFLVIWKNALIKKIPADTDVFKTSSGRLKKVTTSYDETRRRHDVWKKTLHLRRLEDG